jgi:hypothetical protein
MMGLELLAGWLVKGGASTIFGGLFSWLEIRGKQKHEAKMAEIQMQREDKQRAHEMAYAAQEAESAERRLEIETEGEIEVAAYDAMKTAHESDKATYSSGIKVKLKGWFGGLVGNFGALMMFFNDFYRGVVRPSVTVYGWGFVTYIWVDVAASLEMMGPDQKYEMCILILNAVLFMTARATGFWFGDRSKLPKVK